MKQILKKIVIATLTLEAKLVLKKYSPKIIAVTGSVGKTSTKDAIYTALSGPLSIRKNQKSFNSEIGVPLTILGLENAWGNPLKWFENIVRGAWLLAFPHAYPKWLVLEVGADHPGDIQSVTEWLKPDIAVLTRIPDVPVHVEYFRDSDALAEEKAHLLKSLKTDGVAILNADDERVLTLGSRVSTEVIHYGYDKPAIIHGTSYGYVYENASLAGIQFKIQCDTNVIPVTLRGVVGMQHVYPVLAAAAVGLYLKIPLVKIAESFEHHEYPRGRMNILSGINGSTIIDDTYNSSPIALEYALKTLKEVKTSGRKIAVLGDMLELGSYSVDSHKKLGALASQCADTLLTSGVRARDFKDAAIAQGMKETHTQSFANSVELGDFLKEFAKEGDIILVKGSQGMRMEKAVYAILEDKENAKNLLVRQEREWKKR